MGESISDVEPSKPARVGRFSAWITVVLSVSAAMELGYWSYRGLGEWDTEPLESPLILSVARQLVAGPGELYGPFGARNPLVLIHAPLYYRAAALAAWPMARAGLHPVSAARVAGRLLSVVGLGVTLAAAYRLARQDRGSSRAAWWAVLLIAASPMLAGQPFAVRPDMVGVALQTAGVLLVVLALRDPDRAVTRVPWAFVLFGLAACVKQHMIAAAGVSTLLLLAGWREGRISSRTIARGLGALLGTVAVVYGLEWVVTSGRIWEGAFVAAGQVGRIHPGGLSHVHVVLAGIGFAAVGPIVLLTSAGLAIAGASRGIGRRILLASGIGLAGLIMVSQVLRPVFHHPGFGALISHVGLVLLAIVVPANAWNGRAVLLGDRLDVALGWYAAAELAVALVLFDLSTGAWLNYTIQLVVFAAILVARAVSRVVDAGLPSRNLWPIAGAVLSVVVSTFDQITDSEMEVRRERAARELMIENLELPPSAFFFFDRPGLNRIDGRFDLVYDDWLYPVFESLHLAESRSGWLGMALRSRSLRAVVFTSREPRIPGTGLDLNRLGYRANLNVGPYYVWTR